MKKQTKTTILDNGYNRFQTQCTKCGCEFEYDIKTIKGKYHYFYVTCPICGKQCEHSLKENVRKCDVVAKYKDEIRAEIRDGLTSINTFNLIHHIDCSLYHDRIDPDIDYDMVKKWWVPEKEKLREKYCKGEI